MDEDGVTDVSLEAGPAGFLEAARQNQKSQRISLTAAAARNNATTNAPPNRELRKKRTLEDENVAPEHPRTLLVPKNLEASYDRNMLLNLNTLKQQIAQSPTVAIIVGPRTKEALALTLAHLQSAAANTSASKSSAQRIAYLSFFKVKELTRSGFFGPPLQLSSHTAHISALVLDNTKKDERIADLRQQLRARVQTIRRRGATIELERQRLSELQHQQLLDQEAVEVEVGEEQLPNLKAVIRYVCEMADVQYPPGSADHVKGADFKLRQKRMLSLLGQKNSVGGTLKANQKIPALLLSSTLDLLRDMGPTKYIVFQSKRELELPTYSVLMKELRKVSIGEPGFQYDVLRSAQMYFSTLPDHVSQHLALSMDEMTLKGSLVTDNQGRFIGFCDMGGGGGAIKESTMAKVSEALGDSMESTLQQLDAFEAQKLVMMRMTPLTAPGYDMGIFWAFTHTVTGIMIAKLFLHALPLTAAYGLRVVGTTTDGAGDMQLYNRIVYHANNNPAISDEKNMRWHPSLHTKLFSNYDIIHKNKNLSTSFFLPTHQITKFAYNGAGQLICTAMNNKILGKLNNKLNSGGVNTTGYYPKEFGPLSNADKMRCGERFKFLGPKMTAMLTAGREANLPGMDDYLGFGLVCEFFQRQYNVLNDNRAQLKVGNAAYEDIVHCKKFLLDWCAEQFPRAHQVIAPGTPLPPFATMATTRPYFMYLPTMECCTGMIYTFDAYISAADAYFPADGDLMMLPKKWTTEQLEHKFGDVRFATGAATCTAELVTTFLARDSRSEVHRINTKAQSEKRNKARDDGDSLDPFLPFFPAEKLREANSAVDAVKIVAAQAVMNADGIYHMVLVV